MKKNIRITIITIILCSVVFSQTEDKIPKLEGHPIDSIGRAKRDDLMARIDILYTALLAEPNSEGVIVVRFETNQKVNSKSIWLRLFLHCFEFRKMDKTRFTFVLAEHNYQEQTDFWYVPPGAEIPNSKDSNIVIKGENLRQAINTVFRKN